MKEMVNLNFRWFMQTLLDRKDRMSMYCGLEVRVPFCDYRIAEYLYSVPWNMKDYRGREKGLLRYAMSSILPHSVLHRKKSPYPKTWDPKYYDLVSGCLQILLQDREAPLWQLVNPNTAEDLLDEWDEEKDAAAVSSRVADTWTEQRLKEEDVLSGSTGLNVLVLAGSVEEIGKVIGGLAQRADAVGRRQGRNGHQDAAASFHGHSNSLFKTQGGRGRSTPPVIWLVTA